jgi:hypothetical protein
MRRTILLVATMALTLLVASGVALAVTKTGTKVKCRGIDPLQFALSAISSQPSATT